MSYYVSNMIGIRLSGVFGGATDMDDLRTQVGKVIAEMAGGDSPVNIRDLSRCMSGELAAHKGSYAVIAGVFNYWTYPHVSEFAARLSAELGTEVMLMSWDEVKEEMQCQVFLHGRPLFEVPEDPIGRVLRRVM